MHRRQAGQPDQDVEVTPDGNLDPGEWVPEQGEEPQRLEAGKPAARHGTLDRGDAEENIGIGEEQLGASRFSHARPASRLNAGP